MKPWLLLTRGRYCCKCKIHCTCLDQYGCSTNIFLRTSRYTNKSQQLKYWLQGLERPMRIAASFLDLREGNWQAKKIMEMHDIKAYESCCIIPVSKGEQLTGQEDTGNAWRLQNYLVTIGSCFSHSTVRYLCIALGTRAAGYWFLLVMPNFFCTL